MKSKERVSYNRIRNILDSRGIKIKWLAEQLDKSYPTVYGYVSNIRQPSIKDLYRIAEILEVDAKELLSDKKVL